MNILQKELSAIMPVARQYGRALTGDTETSDLLLLQATANVLKRVPSIALLARSSVVFPLLLIEFHKQLDGLANSHRALFQSDMGRYSSDQSEVLYELVDKAVQDLPELQRRVYLLITITQFQFSVVSRIVSEPLERVNALFDVAHLSVLEHLNSRQTRQVA